MQAKQGGWKSELDVQETCVLVCIWRCVVVLQPFLRAQIRAYWAPLFIGCIYKKTRLFRDVMCIFSRSIERIRRIIVFSTRKLMTNHQSINIYWINRNNAGYASRTIFYNLMLSFSDEKQFRSIRRLPFRTMCSIIREEQVQKKRNYNTHHLRGLLVSLARSDTIKFQLLTCISQPHDLKY